MSEQQEYLRTVDEELAQYFDAIENAQPSDTADIQGLIRQADYLNVVMSRSGQIMADIQEILSRMKRELALIYPNVTATHLRMIVDGDVAAPQRIYDRAERLNRLSVHRCDMIRTVVSMAKEEMIQARQQASMGRYAE